MADLEAPRRTRGLRKNARIAKLGKKEIEYLKRERRHFQLQESYVRKIQF